MRFFLRQKYPIYFFIATYLLSGLSCLEGLVLCIGQDGHFALEAAHESKHYRHAHEGRPAADSNYDEEHSGPCRDILFVRATSEAALIRSREAGRQSTRPSGDLSAVSIAERDFSSRSLSIILRARASTDATPLAPFLSSTVLLI